MKYPFAEFKFADRLRHHREKIGITKADAAIRCNLKYSQYNDYEYNKNLPNAYTLEKICVGLNVSADYLLGLKLSKTKKQKNEPRN
jgi:transcriptional regulator with XRE-family HTH domain